MSDDDIFYFGAFFSSYICSERLRPGPAALWISVWVLTQLKVAEPFVAAPLSHAQPDAPCFPSQTLARSRLLALPASHPRTDIFAKELVYRQTRLPCFPAAAYLLEITRVSACPRATGQALTADTSLRLVAASRGQTLALLRETQPGPANVGTGMFHPGSRDTMLVKRQQGWDLPAFGKSERPRGSSGCCGNGSSEGLVLSCDSSSALPRPPRASSEELMKSAGCGQPRCGSGMFWSRLLTLCFAYCVSNAIRASTRSVSTRGKDCQPKMKS